MLRFTPIAALLLAVPVSFADVVDAPAAPVPGGGEELTATSFESFAAEWMRKVREDEARHRARGVARVHGREVIPN